MLKGYRCRTATTCRVFSMKVIGSTNAEVFGVPYGSRTPTRRGRRREREATYCNSTELRGMDSTLPHLRAFRKTLIGLLMDSRSLATRAAVFRYRTTDFKSAASAIPPVAPGDEGEFH